MSGRQADRLPGGRRPECTGERLPDDDPRFRADLARHLAAYHIARGYCAGKTVLAPQVFNSTALVQNITGLTNGVVYRFKVAAKNSRGNGPASALSATATPTATPALRLINNASIGQPILVDANGMTVYLYTIDGSNTTSSVNGGLRVAWPYVLWGGTPSVGPGLDEPHEAINRLPDCRLGADAREAWWGVAFKDEHAGSVGKHPLPHHRLEPARLHVLL